MKMREINDAGWMRVALSPADGEEAGPPLNKLFWLIFKFHFDLPWSCCVINGMGMDGADPKIPSLNLPGQVQNKQLNTEQSS